MSGPGGSDTTDTVASPDPPPGRDGGEGTKRILQRYGLIIVWALMIMVFGILEPDSFLRLGTFRSIFSSQSILLLLSLSLLPSLILGGLDLSIAGVMSLSLTLVGWLNVTHGWPIGAAILVALAVGLLIGLINAYVVVGLGADAIVVTLGMGTAVQGAALGVNNLAVSGISKSYVSLVRTPIFGIQAIFYFVVAITLLMWYVFRFTPLGRYIYFAGAGPSVAKLAGIPTRRIQFGSFLFGSFMAALAGVALAGVLGSSDPTVGPTFLLPAFAGVFLGATTLSPGRFNPLGTWIAVYFLGTGVTGFELMGQSGWTREVFYGSALILALAIPRLIDRDRGEQGRPRRRRTRFARSGGAA